MTTTKDGVSEGELERNRERDGEIEKKEIGIEENNIKKKTKQN